MSSADHLGVWELGDGLSGPLSRTVSERRATSAPSYSAVLLEDQIDRLDLLLEPGARPSLDPAGWLYVDGMGLCRLDHHEAYAVRSGPRFVLKLVVCNPAARMQ